MFAIIETGGKQYKVSPEEVVYVEKLAGEPDTKITFDKVLLVGDGDNTKVGAPLIDGATVEGVIVNQEKAPKIRVFKYKAKARYRRTQGHRQQVTAVKIGSIKTS